MGNLTKYDRFSSANFLWSHNVSWRQKFSDEYMKARYVDSFHDNRWYSTKICVKMEEGEDEKQGPRQAEKEETKTLNNLTVMSQKTSIE